MRVWVDEDELYPEYTLKDVRPLWSDLYTMIEVPAEVFERYQGAQKAYMEQREIIGNLVDKARWD